MVDQNTISRASGTLTFPANFQLIAAMNPCSCGYWGDPTHNCACSPAMVTRYQKKNLRPAARSLRHAKHMDVPCVDYEKLASDCAGQASETVRQRVSSARERQLAHFDATGMTCNAATPLFACNASKAFHLQSAVQLTGGV